MRSLTILVISAFFAASAMGQSSSDWPDKLRVEIEVDTGPIDCSDSHRGGSLNYVQRISGVLDRASYEFDGVYAGMLRVTATFRMCEMRCPDGGCGGICMPTWQVSGMIPAELAATPPLHISFYGDRDVVSKVSPNDCPHSLMDRDGEASLVEYYDIEENEQTWHPREGSRTFALDTRGGKITLTPVDDSLKAIVRPASARRGSRVELDGSASTGSPERWTWTIEPRPCPSLDLPGGNHWSGPTAPKTTMSGAKVSFPLLCDVDVTLEVRRGENVHRSKALHVRATARSWKMKVAKPEQSAFGDKLYGGPAGGACLEFNAELGRNVCAIDEADLPPKTKYRHWIHRDRAAAQFASHPAGVVVQAVTEGPFKGFFYSSEQNLRIQREEQVHRALDAISPKLARHTLAHEAMHTRLAMEAFRAEGDPAPLVEQLVGKNEVAVVANINGAIFAVEEAMAAASTEAAVAAQLGKRPANVTLVFPTRGGGTCEVHVTDWSDVGN